MVNVGTYTSPMDAIFFLGGMRNEPLDFGGFFPHLSSSVWGNQKHNCLVTLAVSRDHEIDELTLEVAQCNKHNMSGGRISSKLVLPN